MAQRIDEKSFIFQPTYSLFGARDIDKLDAASCTV